LGVNKLNISSVSDFIDSGDMLCMHEKGLC
jgi:hypothetical protein